MEDVEMSIKPYFLLFGQSISPRMNPQPPPLTLLVFSYSLLYVAAKIPKSVSSSVNEMSQSPQAPVVVEHHLYTKSSSSSVSAGVVGGLHVIRSELAFPAVNAQLLPSAHLASAGNSLAGTRCLAKDTAD